MSSKGFLTLASIVIIVIMFAVNPILGIISMFVLGILLDMATNKEN